MFLGVITGKFGFEGCERFGGAVIDGEVIRPFARDPPRAAGACGHCSGTVTGRATLAPDHSCDRAGRAANEPVTATATVSIPLSQSVQE